jgi:outer membrane receptor for ferrienterochelin and colicins
MTKTTRQWPRPAARAAAAALAAAASGAAAQDTQALQPPQTVVVSATRHAMALVDAPAAVSVISAEQLLQRGATNLFDALRGETGVAVFGRSVSGRKTLSLRGMDSRHTLVLVDGRRISASDGLIGHTDFQFDWIASVDIERIEVVRGPMSVLYGAEALGGVVNIITRPPGDERRVAVELEGARADGGRGGDGHRAQARVELPLGAGLGFAASVADARRGAIAAPADPRVSELEGRHRRDAVLQLAWRPTSAQRIEAEVRHGDEDRQALARERSGQRRLHASLTDVRRSHAALAWHLALDDAHQHHAMLRAYRSTLAMDNQRTAGVAALRPNRLEDTVVEAQAGGSPSAQWRLTAGAESREETLHNQGLPADPGRARHDALYLQGEYTPATAVTVTAGVRGDHHRREGSEWSPRLYAVWRLAPDWTLKGGAGHGFKPPTLKQITAGYQEDEGPNTYLGNPLLRAETNDAAEIGLGLDRPALGAQVMLFNNRVRDLIVPRLLSSRGGRGTYVFDNIDRARFRGVEASLALRLPAGLQWHLNAQWLDATDGRGDRLERRPRRTLGTRLEGHWGDWTAMLRVEHAAGMLLAGTIPGQAPQAVPDLTMAGASVSLALRDGFSLWAGVDNLGQLVLAEKSALYTWAEAPRTWRLALRGRW